MKKVFPILLLIIICASSNSIAQESYPSGTPIGRIFADFKYSVDRDIDYQGFNVNRAWLGYKYLIDEHFSAQVIIDIGAPLGTEDLSSKRYAFFRNALVSYNIDKLTVSIGLTDTRSAKTELKLWGKRYLSRPFLLNYKFTNIADIGIIVDYNISDIISIDASILNGEGYTKIESDNSQLYSMGITLTPVEGLTLRAYADTYKRDDAAKNTLSATGGYQHEKFALAFGYNYKTDFDWTDGNNTGGFTTFGAINLTPKMELFGRYDMLKSVILEGDTEGWNIDNDGSLVVAGIQYKFRKQIKASVNYQAWNPASSDSESWRFIQANMEFRF